MIVGFLYFLIDVLIICLFAWALVSLVNWAPVIPAPVKQILIVVIYVFAAIYLLLGLIGLMSAPLPGYYYPFAPPRLR